jgi:hypothetical protein
MNKTIPCLVFQLIGMLAHRIMTLGHIVSTTSIRMSLFKKKKHFDGDRVPTLKKFLYSLADGGAE